MKGGAGRLGKGHLRLLFNETIHVQDRITCIKYPGLNPLCNQTGHLSLWVVSSLKRVSPPTSLVGKLRCRGGSEVIHSSRAGSGEFRALGSKANPYLCRDRGGGSAGQQGGVGVGCCWRHLCYLTQVCRVPSWMNWNLTRLSGVGDCLQITQSISSFRHAYELEFLSVEAR